MKLHFTIHESGEQAPAHTSFENEGTFAFTTGKEGVFRLCFRHEPEKGVHTTGTPIMYNRRVKLQYNTGVGATDFTKMARDQHLSKLELDAVKLTRSVEEVLNDMLYFKNREMQLRDSNETINARVMWLSFLSMVIIVVLAGLQLSYLRRFFASKKVL